MYQDRTYQLDIVGFVEDAFAITKEDCDRARKVKLRDGRVATLYSYTAPYLVHGFVENSDALTTWKANGSIYQEGIDKLDIVSFVEDTFTITKEDCEKGRKVMLKNGKIGIILGWTGIEDNEVRCKFGDISCHWSNYGKLLNMTTEYDMVGFVDEVTITKEDCDRGRKVKLRDGRIGAVLTWHPIPGGVSGRVNGETYGWYPNGKARANTDHETDIVGFVDETFESELTSLLNKYKGTDVLAKYIEGSLKAFSEATKAHTDWYGK
jgi:hypothetical protein